MTFSLISSLQGCLWHVTWRLGHISTVLPGYQQSMMSPPVIRLPGYRLPPPPGDVHNLIIIAESSSGVSSSNYETAPELRHMTPEEQKKQQWLWQIEWAFKEFMRTRYRRYIEFVEFGRFNLKWEVILWAANFYFYSTDYSLDSYIALLPSQNTVINAQPCYAPFLFQNTAFTYLQLYRQLAQHSTAA